MALYETQAMSGRLTIELHELAGGELMWQGGFDYTRFDTSYCD